MRFFPDGPSIPDTLLHRRDQGRVVFMCGAGISLNAGMPSFLELTRYVIDYFDPPESSSITLALKSHLEGEENEPDRPKTPLDQIFQLLHQEYGREEVNALVAKRLSFESVEDNHCNQHAIITRLSRGTDRKPQIVTTNFDKLFEHVDIEQNITVHEPPAFPNLELGIPISGVTYLHGRIKDTDSNLHPYILSSADFGRAYLSEGWATKFIRDLLKNYTVVLIGYQAEDAPIKYLLQGLNHNGLSEHTNLYAFDRGKPETIEAKWRDRGVTAIACKDYEGLWKTLEAWALRADDPRKWRAKVIEMSMRGPRDLRAHERGQVAHVVRTTSGARLFASAEPPPSPEWLCVFDSRCRMDKESRNYGNKNEIFNPYSVYGLDDDLPRLSGLSLQSKWYYNDLLEWQSTDSNPTDVHSLAVRTYFGFESIPTRLDHIANWIIKHIDKPITAWWVVRQSRLHSRLLNYIRLTLLQQTSLTPQAYRVWNLILEAQLDERNFTQNDGFYEIRNRINSEGWTSSVLRRLEEVTKPIVSAMRPHGIHSSMPPLGDWEKTNLTDIARWEVKGPHQNGEDIEVPRDIIESVYRIAERHLRRASELSEDLGIAYMTIPTCYPVREVNGNLFESNDFFSWFLRLLIQMIELKPDVIKGYVTTWKNEESILFKKLSLFVFNHNEIFNRTEVMNAMMALPQKTFWEVSLRRELLFLLHDRWDEFSEEEISLIVKRLIIGPDKNDYWTGDEYPRKKKEFSCRYLRWLALHGKELPEESEKLLNEMIAEIPDWNETWAQNLTQEEYGSIRTVNTDESPNAIINLPLSEIIEYAQSEYESDFGRINERRSFNGLVKIKPHKALASLSLLAKRSEYPVIFWTALIENWPKNVSKRLFVVLLHRIKRLPHILTRELRHPLSSWFQEHLMEAFRIDKNLAWSTLDHYLNGLLSDDGVSERSALGDFRYAGEIVERSRFTFDHAINSPIGRVIDGLFQYLGSLKLEQSDGIPDEIKVRLQKLLQSNGEGGSHTVAIISRQIDWLHYIDPDWILKIVIPWFKFDHNLVEPAWNGFLSSRTIPSIDITRHIKPMFLKIFPEIYKWKWDANLATIATQMIIRLNMFRANEEDGLTEKEARDCLRSMNDVNRQDAISYLCNIGARKDSGWVKHVVPFINNVWPKERKYITSSTVRSWLRLLERTDDHFPVVLSTVKRFLAPIGGDGPRLYSFGKEFKGKKSLAEKYPSEVLTLFDLIIPNNLDYVPPGLAEQLELIIESNSELSSDLRFIRLIDVVEQN